MLFKLKLLYVKYFSNWKYILKLKFFDDMIFLKRVDILI